MWSEKVKLLVTHRDTLIFAGQGQRAVVLSNPGDVAVRLHAGTLHIDIGPKLVGALTAPQDIFVRVADGDARIICDVQFAVSGT